MASRRGKSAEQLAAETGLPEQEVAAFLASVPRGTIAETRSVVRGVLDSVTFGAPLSVEEMVQVRAAIIAQLPVTHPMVEVFWIDGTEVIVQMHSVDDGRLLLRETAPVQPSSGS